MDSLVAFLPVAAGLVVTPGVNNLVVVRRTIVDGPAAGMVAIAGTSTGILLWAAAVAIGVGSVLRSSPAVWVAVQWSGAAVLVILGTLSLLRALTRADAKPTTVGGPSRSGVAASFLPALSTSLVNPRAGITAVALLPQFVAPAPSPGPTTLALGLLWAVLAAVWNLLGVWLVARGRPVLRTPAAVRVADAVGGGFMVAVGVSVALAT
jgi:threonine/homoserine/homoserine lactone efflux protein